MNGGNDSYKVYSLDTDLFNKVEKDYLNKYYMLFNHIG